MAGSKWPDRLRGLSVFIGCAIGTWVFMVGLAWVGERLSASLQTQEPVRSASATTIVPTDFPRKLREHHLTGADCAAALSAMDEATLLSTLRELQAPFWRTNANASLLIRQAARSLAASKEPDRVLADLRAVLQASSASPHRRRRLLASAYSGVLESRSVSREDLLAALKGAEDEDALALLEVWLDFQAPTTPKSDLATAKEIMSEISPERGARLEDRLALMVVRLWAHRAPPIADAMLFAKSYEHENNVHLLTEGARILRMANPEELHRRLVQFAPAMASEAGSIAAQTSIARDDVLAMARQMSETDRTKFLESYLQTIGYDDPREAAKFAESITAKEAPKPVASLIVQNLAQTADLEGLKDWIGTVPVSEQASLWDAMFSGHGPGELSASAALFYLQHRPQDFSPNIGVLRSALGLLSYQEALQYLSTADDTVRKAFSPPPPNLVQKEVARLRTENPSGIAPFLDALPSTYRIQMVEAAFPFWWSEGPDLLANVADTTSDPAVSAIARATAMRTGLDNLSLPEIQAQLLRSVVASPNHEDVFWDTTERILKLQTSSSEAIRFIESLPSGKLKEQAVVSFSKQWADLDPVAAADWLAQLPVSHTRDRATSQLISAVRDDPERALANAAGIHDPKLRFESVRTVLRLWRDQDPKVAEAAISAAGFSAEDAAMFRSMAGIGREGSR